MIRKTGVLSLIALSLTATQSARAFQTETAVSETPFDDPARYSQSLPTLGGASDQDEEWSKKLAAVAKSIGEASNNSDSNVTFGQQAGVWAFNHLRDEVADRVESEGQSLLSPYGTAQLDLKVDMNGNFTGTGGDLFSALADENSRLTFSQLGLHDTGDGLVGNAGLGQRWDAGDWLLVTTALLTACSAAACSAPLWARKRGAIQCASRPTTISRFPAGKIWAIRSSSAWRAATILPARAICPFIVSWAFR